MKSEYSISVISNQDTIEPNDIYSMQCNICDNNLNNSSLNHSFSSSHSKSSYSSNNSSSVSYSSSGDSVNSESSDSGSESCSSSYSSDSSSKKKIIKNKKSKKIKGNKSKNKKKDNININDKDNKDTDDIIIEELPIPEFTTEENSEFIEVNNIFMNEINEKFLKMTPYELFLFHYNELITKFVEYSNKNAEINHNWTACNITKDDIIKYIFCYIYLSIYDLPEIEMLWETSSFFKSIIPNIIKKARYSTINKYFSISSNNNLIKANNKQEYLSELILTLNQKWKEAYPYTKYLSIDEAMTSYKGNISFKQYSKAKHKRHGIKLFSKASADKGYCYHMLLYTGKSFNYDKTCGIGSTIIKQLTQGHENNKYHFTFDSFFSNMHTFNFLEKNGINFTCTFALNKKAIPDEIKKIKLSKNQNKYYKIKNNNVKLFLSRDNKRQIQLI